MIPVAVITGAVLLVGITLAVKFWNKIIQFLKNLVNKLEGIVKGTLKGVKVFLKKSTDGIQYIVRIFSQMKEDGAWEEGLVNRPLNQNEIPKDKKKQMEQSPMETEFDISEELELKMKQGR